MKTQRKHSKPFPYPVDSIISTTYNPSSTRLQVRRDWGEERGGDLNQNYVLIQSHISHHRGR